MPESDAQKSRRPQDRDFKVDRWDEFTFERADDPYENRSENRKSQASVSQYAYEGWEQNAFPNKEPAQPNSGNLPIGVAAELERQVTAALAARPGIDMSRIQVRAESEKIVLSGFVRDKRSSRAAERAASQASGAVSVVNRLVIEGSKRS